MSDCSYMRVTRKIKRRKQMKLKKWITAFLTTAVIASPATAFAQGDQSINIATNGELSVMDSSLYNDVPTSDMLGQIFEGLYRVGKGSEVELGQAKDVEVSEDGLTYTFTLRDDIVWTDGQPVTANDFVYSYQRLVDPEAGSVAASSVEVFKNAKAIREGDKQIDELGVKALDDKTLEITLEYPAPYLPKLLSGSRFLPVSQKHLEEVGTDNGTTAENIVSNGPFKMEGWNGTILEWTLTKNDQYWDADNVQLNSANVSVVKETSTGADLFDAGELDYFVLTSDFVQQYEGADFVHTVPKATIGYIHFNAQRENTGNAHIRRAIAKSIDRELYTQSVTQDGSVPLYGQVPRDFDVNEAGEDYRDAKGDLLTYDVKAAQEDWKKGLEELGKDKLELELLTSDVDLSKRTAEFLQAQLQENLPGLTLSIRSVPLKNRLEMNSKGEFDMFYGTWAPDYQDAINFLEQYATGGGINFGKYSNPDYDKLIEQARTDLATKPEERRQALMDAEQIAVEEETAVAPIYQASTVYLLNPKVQNFEVYSFGRTINLRLVSISE